jgi:5,10-methylenetetrahydromethanopterin reductase
MRKGRKSGKKAELGIGFTGGPYQIKKIVEFAKLAETSGGFSSFWFAEDYFLRDAISNISCVAFATKRIKISTGVINPFSRNPVLIAETLATLDEVAKGRVGLAIGTGVQPLIENMGIIFRHPVLAIKESIEIIRELLSGKKVSYSGQVFSARDVKLWENPYFSLLLNEEEFKPLVIPIYVAAIGKRMLELAGRIADGVLLTAGFATENVKQALSRIEAGARESQRSLGDLEVGNYIITCLGRPGKGVKGFLTFDVAYTRPENLVAIGIPEKKVLDIKTTLERKGMAEASSLITEDIIDCLAACGSKNQIQSKIEEFRNAGVTQPILLPLETSVPELIKSLS